MSGLRFCRSPESQTHWVRRAPFWAENSQDHHCPGTSHSQDTANRLVREVEGGISKGCRWQCFCCAIGTLTTASLRYTVIYSQQRPLCSFYPVARLVKCQGPGLLPTDQWVACASAGHLSLKPIGFGAPPSGQKILRTTIVLAPPTTSTSRGAMFEGKLEALTPTWSTKKCASDEVARKNERLSLESDE